MWRLGYSKCLAFVCLMLTSVALSAAGPCGCLDIYDLASQRAEAKAAIAAYQKAIADWIVPPPPLEPLRKNLQNERIQPAVSSASFPDAERATGVTDASCVTTTTAGSTCLQESVSVHELEHRSNCRLEGTHRYVTMADYAREEIAAYETQLTWIEAALKRLESECRYSFFIVDNLEAKVCDQGSCVTAVTNGQVDVPLDRAGDSVMGLELMDTTITSTDSYGKTATLGSIEKVVQVSGLYDIAAGTIRAKVYMRRSGGTVRVFWSEWTRRPPVDVPLKPDPRAECEDTSVCGLEFLVPVRAHPAHPGQEQGFNVPDGHRKLTVTLRTR